MLLLTNTPVGATITATEVAELLASDGAANDEFGFAVAVSGNTAVIGAWRADVTDGESLRANAGAAYCSPT